MTTQGNIILIDDDKEHLKKISLYLEKIYNLKTFDSPRHFLERLNSDLIKNTQCILIDLHMPEIDGLNLVQKIKEVFIYSPALIIFTNYNTQNNRISAYSKNISDFICKSVSNEELSIRIANAITTHSGFIKTNIKNSQINDLRYDSESMSFKFQNDELDLTKTETKILYSLIIQNYLNKSKEDLISRVWNERVVSAQTLRSHLYNLNEKLSIAKIKFYIDEKRKVRIEHI